MVEKTDLAPFMGGVRIPEVTLTEVARERLGARYGFRAKPFPDVVFVCIVSRSPEKGRVDLDIYDEELEIWRREQLGKVGPKFKTMGFTVSVSPEEIQSVKDKGSFYEYTAEHSHLARLERSRKS